MIFAVLLVGGACALGAWLWWNYTHFSRHGVRQGPAVPLVGDMGGVLMQKEHMTDVLTRSYKSFPEDRLVGRYDFLTPFVVIRDPELLKKVTVKDFRYFVNRRILIDSKTEPLLGRSLLTLRGDEWKDMRCTLSPAFTSSKIRQMMPFMVKVGDQMVQSLKTRIEQSKVDYIDLEAKTLTARYAHDVMASFAFGIDVNSQFEDNLLYNMNREVVSMDISTKLRFLGHRNVTWLMRLLNLSVYSKKIRDFYSNVVLGNMKQREKMQIHRPDMIHLLMEAKKGRLSHDTKSANDDDAGFATVEESIVSRSKNKRAWSDMDFVAQAVLFHLAGFEIVATTMSFLLYELGVNPDCQEKLVQEIKENEKKNEGEIDYHSVQQMKYLDMVVSEALRKWPGLPVTDRLCVRDYNLGKPNSKATKDYILRPGALVVIPIWSFHYDPIHFPNPEKFDPERFSEENKHNIDRFVYMPFGLGPRNCIASRFVVCELKVMAYQLLQHVEVCPCEKSVIPIRLNPKEGFLMKPEGDNWLRFKMRK